MTAWLVWLIKINLRRYAGSLLRLLVLTSAMTIFLQNVFLEQTRRRQQLKLERRYFRYPMSFVRFGNDTLPDYARRLSYRDDPDISPQVDSYKRFGKAFVIALFKSSFPKYHIVKLNNPNVRIFKHPKVFDTNFNGNITIHHINKYAYFRSSPKYLYVLSAIYRDKNVLKNSNKLNFSKGKPEYTPGEHVDHEKVRKTSKNHEDDVVLTGWIQELATNTSILCCFLRNDNNVISYANIKRLLWTQVKKQELIAGKLFCPIPSDINKQDLIGAALSMPTEKCRKETFMHIERTEEKQTDSVGICAKITYGSMEAGRIVEWLEIQKYIQVDKVLLYVYNLNEKAVKVIKHYALSGFVDMIPFDYPMAAELERYVGQKEALAYIDEQVVVFDCMERLRGYTYAAIMDMDEILYAKAAKNQSVKLLMKKLQSYYPDAAGFTFKTELFITDWPTNGQTDTHLFWHSKHQNRTRPLTDRPKNMLVTDRVVLGSIWTHNFTTKAGYDRYQVPVNLAIVKHYRPCRQNWGCDQRKGYIDKSVVKIAKIIKDTIYKQFKLLKISRNFTV